MKNKNLLILLSGQLVSQIGDKFYMLALSFWVLEATGSPAYMGIAMFCSFFPAAVLGFFSGVIVDRYSRKNIIVITDILRGVIVLVLILLHSQDWLTVPVILIVQVLLSINTAFFDPAIPSIIPQIVAKDQLIRANSLTQMVDGVSSIMGPVIGGICLSLFGYGFIFVFNAISYLLSGIFEMFINVQEDIDHQKIDNRNLIKEFREGLSFVFKSMPLIVLLIIISLLHFFIGSIEAFAPVIAQSIPGEGTKNLGYLQTSLGIGIILSAAIMSALNIKSNETFILFSATSAIGLTYILMALHFIWFANELLSLLIIFGLFGAIIIIAATCFRSIIQKSIPNDFSGRVFGIVGSVSDISIPLAMLTYGFLLTYLSKTDLLLGTGLIIFIISPLLFLLYSKKSAPKFA